MLTDNIDTVKIRLQTTNPSDGRFKGPLDCFLKTIRHEGPRALYKGATPPLVGWMFMDSIMYVIIYIYICTIVSHIY
jgi:solute carrier family 25 carnitine/acylcarnitine transporter 20/29